jgi:hypothetical protein
MLKVRVLRGNGSLDGQKSASEEPKIHRRECEATAYLRAVKPELRLPGTNAFVSNLCPKRCMHE